MSNIDGAVVVHISDPHLHPPLTEKGRVLLSRGLVKSHAFHILRAATVAIRRIYARTRPRSFCVVATGDLTTAGEPIAFRMAREILERRSVTWNHMVYDVGIGMSDTRFTVPGNHDRYLILPIFHQTDVFEAEFHAYLEMANWELYGLKAPDTSTGAVRHLPYCRVFYDTPKSGGKTAFVVIGVDSTLVSGSKVARIAKGRVSQASLNYLERLCRDIDTQVSVMTSDGKMHDLTNMKVVKIVLLHHHPYLPPDLKEKGLTELLDANVFVESCQRAGIHLVLFGHQHATFVTRVDVGHYTERRSTLVFGAAGSLCQFGEPRGNAFNVYHVRSDSMDYEVHRFDGVRFRLSERESIKFA